MSLYDLAVCVYRFTFFTSVSECVCIHVCVPQQPAPLNWVVDNFLEILVTVYAFVGW